MAKKGRKRKPVLGSPEAALTAYGISLESWKAGLAKIGVALWKAVYYPTLDLYDHNRPKEWPTTKALLRGAGLPISGQGWRQFVRDSTGQEPITHAESLRIAHKRRADEGNAIPPLTHDERRATIEREQRALRTKRPACCRNADAQESYRAGMLPCRQKWRPIMDWLPNDAGEWDYRKVGEYSTWMIY